MSKGRFTKYVLNIDSAAAAGGTCSGSGGGGGSEYTSEIDNLNSNVNGGSPSSASEPIAISFLGNNINARLAQAVSLNLILTGTNSAAGNIRDAIYDATASLSSTHTLSRNLSSPLIGSIPNSSIYGNLSFLNTRLSSTLVNLESVNKIIDNTIASYGNINDGISELGQELTSSLRGASQYKIIYDGTAYNFNNISGLSSSLSSTLSTALVNVSKIDVLRIGIDGGYNDISTGLENINSNLSDIGTGISSSLNVIFDGEGTLQSTLLKPISDYLNEDGEDLLNGFTSFKRYSSSGSLESAKTAATRSGSFAIVNDAPTSGTAPQTYVSNGTSWAPIVASGGGGGGLDPLTAGASSLDFGTNMTGSVFVSNPNAFPVGATVTSSSSDFYVRDGIVDFTVPGGSTYELNVFRTNFSTFSSEELYISSSNTITIDVDASSAGLWTSLATNLGAAHIYDFAVGDTLSDKAGSLNLSVVNASRYTLGAGAIAGANGSYTVTNTGAASGLTIPNANWHRDTTPRSLVWVGNVASITNSRATFMGPGSASGNTNSFFGFEFSTNWKINGPTNAGSSGWDTGLNSANNGNIMLILVWKPDAVAGTIGYADMHLVTTGASRSRKREMNFINGGTTNGTFYLGGDGSVFFSQGARWDHFSVFERALSDDEIEFLFKARGLTPI